jgi:hypothetical protein
VKAISIHQPWAHFIAAGLKPIENRGRTPPMAIIGQVVGIQATKRKPEDAAYADLAARRPLPPAPKNLPCGGIVGLARVRGFVDGRPRCSGGFVVKDDGSGLRPVTREEREEVARSPWAISGNVWILLDQAEALREIVPCAGSQILFWNVKPEDEAMVLMQHEGGASRDILRAG